MGNERERMTEPEDGEERCEMSSSRRDTRGHCVHGPRAAVVS